MRRGASRISLAVIVSLAVGCSKSNDAETKSPPQQAEPVTAPAPTQPTKEDPPPPPPKPTFDRATLLTLLTTSMSRCVEFDPAVQFLKDNVIRIEYVHGCGEFEKAEVAKVMWQMLEQCVALASAAGADMPTFKIQAFTRNGSTLFTSTTAPKDVARLISKDMGFDDWVVHIGEGPTKLGATQSESEYIKALPAPSTDAKVPEGDELKSDLSAYVEDLECAKEVWKSKLGTRARGLNRN